ELPAKEYEATLATLQMAKGAVQAEPLDGERLRESHQALIGLLDGRLARWKKSEVFEYLGSIATALCVALLLRAVVVEAFKIPSGSMLPTLQIGDHIFVNKFLYGPKIPILD